MSRTKGYKCYNIQCGSCIGKTLCGEPGDEATWWQDRVVDSWTAVDYEKLASSVKLCGSTPKVDQCRKCPYWADGDISKCILRMTTDCFTAITDLLARAEEAEAANTQLDGTVSTLMESNKKLVEELKAHSETELAKAHESLSADWARQKMRADVAEEKYAALLKERFGENASAKMMEMVDTVNEMRKKLADTEERAEKAENIASDLCDDFTDFVTGGVPNAAPYCANFRPECVNQRGWCNGDNKVCKGFLPKAACAKEE